MAVAGSVLTRRLDYQGARPGGLRPYDLGGAPALDTEIRWFPAAYFTTIALAYLGFEARFEQAFALESALGTRRFATHASETSFGLIGRLPLGASELRAGVGYGRHGFAIEQGSELLVPNAEYKYLRAAAEGRVRVEGCLIGVGLGYRGVLSAGGLQATAWFPRATGAGLEARVMLGRELTPHLDVVLGFELRRYRLDLRASTADAAVDLYSAGSLGLSWRLPFGEVS
jgi:hypothetical protein